MAFTNISRIVNSGFRCLQLCCLAAACVAMGSGSAIGQVTWDATLGTPGPEDGGGTWSTSASGTNWWDGTTNIAWPNLTTSSAIFGAGSGAAGTVTVSGGVTTNGITFNAPGSGTYALSGGTITLAGSTPTITANVNASIGSVLAGSAGLIKAGAGTLTLSGSSSYTGGTQINAGSITASNVSAFGAGAVAIAASGTATLTGVSDANAAGFSNTVSGAGVLALASGAGNQTTIVNFSGDLSAFTGTVRLTSGGDFVGITGNYLSGSSAKWEVNNSSGTRYLYTGTATTVAMGELSGNGRIGSNFNANTTWEVGALATNSTYSGVFVNAVSPGTGRAILRKVGSGTLTLTGSSSYSGGTTIDGGVLALGNAGAAGSGPIVVGSAGALSIVHNGAVTTGSVSGNGIISLVGRAAPSAAQPALNADISGFTGTVNANPFSNYVGFGSSSTGSEQARFVLSGGVAAVNAFYAAVTGTFRMGELSGTAAMQGAGGAGAVTWEIGGLNTNSTFAGAIRNSLSGSANSLRKVGSGTLTLTGSSNYTGGTQIDAGAITAANVSAFGAGAVAIAASGTATLTGISASNAAGFSNTVSGAGVFALASGAGNATSIVNFSGDLSAFTGTVRVTSDGDFVGITGNYLSGSSAKWEVNNSSGTRYLYTGTGTTVAMGELSGNGRIGSNYDANTTWEIGGLATSSTFSGVFVNAVSPGAGRAILRKVGSGTLTLTGNSSATGGTEVNGGVLAVGGGGTSGLLAGSASVATGAVLRFNRSDASSFAGVISGSGSVVKQGAGTLTLSGNNSYSGGTQVIAGGIAFGSTTAFGTGTVTLGGGGLQSSIAGTLPNPIAITASSGTFDNQANANTLSGIVSGSGTLVKVGAGTLALSASNSYTGGTQINAGSITASNVSAFGAGAVAIAASGTATLTGVSDANAAGFSNTVSGAGVLALASGAGNQTTIVNFSGDLSAFTGTVRLTSGGDFVGITGNYLSGSSAKWEVNNSSGTRYLYTGTATTVAMGELSGNGRIGSNVSANTTWQVGALSTSSTFSGVFVNAQGNIGRAILRKVGSGTLTLTGNSSATGGTEVNSGVLAVGDGGTSGSLSGNAAVAADAVLRFNRSDASSFAGVISGSGSVVKQGAGTLTLSGTNTYAGQTRISAGALALGVNGSFANSSEIKVGDAGSSAAILDLTAKTAAFAIGSGQTLSGGGTVLVAPGQQFLVQGTFSPGNSPGLFTFDGGTTVLSGTTLLEIFGTSRATSPSHGSGFYDAVNIVDNGTLQFGGNLSFEFSSLFDTNTTFDLFTPATGSALAGNFTGVTVTGGFYTGLEWNQTGNVWKSSNTAAGQSLEFSAATGQLVIVPEPGGLALAGMGIAALGWAATRRRRAIVHRGRVMLCLGDSSVRFPAGDIELRHPARNPTTATTV